MQDSFLIQDLFVKNISNKDISLQKELKNLILFLQENKKEGSIFSMFLKKYSDSEAFQTLDKNITLVETPDDINTLLVIAFYLKFRKMIRDKEYAQFKIEAETFLKKLKKETSIALFFIGMFFGSTEFIEMYYQKSLSILKTFSNESLIIPPIKETPKDVTSNKKTTEEASIKFNDTLFEQIKLGIQKGKKESTKKLIDSIKNIFDKFKFDSSVNGFIESLEKNISIPKTDEKKKYTKEGIINSIRTILKQ